MHILLLTWKDIRHPAKWWAELVMYNYAQRLIKRWHTVTWFSSKFPETHEEEYVDGVHIIRRYSMYTNWLFFPLWYRKFRKTSPPDIIIDQAGWIPFLSFFYERYRPIVFFIHHIWDQEFSRIPLFWWWFKWMYRWMIAQYKDVPTVTVSDSTRKELEEEFWFTKEWIHVIKNASDITPIVSLDIQKKQDRIIFLGRLMSIKRVEDAILSFHHLVSDPRFSHYMLDIIGNDQDIQYKNKLIRLIQQKDLQDKVLFHGSVSKEWLQDLFPCYRAILVPSKKEWFWLVVIEANSYGVPALGYDVAWLRDSIHDGKNGFLLPDGDVYALWEKLKILCSDISLQEKMAVQSLEYVKNLENWDDQTTKLENLLMKIHK